MSDARFRNPGRSHCCEVEQIIYTNIYDADVFKRVGMYIQLFIFGIPKACFYMKFLPVIDIEIFTIINEFAPFFWLSQKIKSECFSWEI